MHTGPQFPTTSQQAPGRGGRTAPLLIGVLAFAVVFLLVVGGTIGYLVLRPGGGGDVTPVAGGSSDASSSVTPSDPDPSPSTDPGTPTPTGEVEPERCWTPDSERTSKNPSGFVRGGGLQFIPPDLHDRRGTPYGIAYTNDLQGTQAHLEGTWQSTIIIGAVQWQPGIEYPGNEVASQEITKCFFYTTDWGEATGRTLDDLATVPVTIAGMSGYQTTATVNFASDPLELTDGAALCFIVLETASGPSIFATETALGVADHEQAAAEALATLTAAS